VSSGIKSGTLLSTSRRSAKLCSGVGDGECISVGLGVLVACKRSRRWFEVASMAPVTDSIRSFVFLAGGCGGAGGCGLGGGGLDGGGLPFFDGGVDATVGATGCCGGLTTGVDCFSGVDVAVPKRSTLLLAKILDDWLVKTLVAGVFIVASNPTLGAVLSMPKEANGLVESADTDGSYDCSLLKFRKGFSPAPEVLVSAKSCRKGLETCGGNSSPGCVA